MQSNAPRAGRSSLFVLLTVGALAACGGEPAQPSVAPAPTPAPTAAPAPAAAEGEPEPEPSTTASAAAAATSAPKASGGGRPLIQTKNELEISGTFGTTPGSKLELGSGDLAVLMLPEGSLDAGYNIVFKIDPKAKGNGASIGKVYRMLVQSPGTTEEVSANSTGTPFELSLPLGGAKEGNLAWGTVATDDKGKEKVTWKVTAPKRVDADAKRAVFELAVLASGYLHLTSKPAS